MECITPSFVAKELAENFHDPLSFPFGSRKSVDRRRERRKKTNKNIALVWYTYRLSTAKPRNTHFLFTFQEFYSTYVFSYVVAESCASAVTFELLNSNAKSVGT